MTRTVLWIALAFSLATGQQLASAGDWPQWRYDAQRSAASPDDLPQPLKQAWVLQLPKLRPAWGDQPKLQFDVAYEPIVADGRMFVGSSFDDSVTAYNTATGEMLWRFYADGPVRFAPAAWRDKLYFCADDGYLYCLDAHDGSLAWRFRGGPSDRKVLGNERLISTWPARGAPVLADGTVYFAAGIWPFMGIFLHALDAETGRVVWTNDGDGSRYMQQPHNTDSFAGVAPQGPLVAIGDKLLVPGGRSVPACYDRRTGKLVYYELAPNGKKGGGFGVVAAGGVFFNGGGIFDLETEKHLASAGPLVAVLGETVYDCDGDDVRAIDLRMSGLVAKQSIDRKGQKVREANWEPQFAAEIDTPNLTAMIVAGSRLYAGAANRLIAYDLPLKDDAPIAWEAPIEGTPTSLMAADDQLFAATLQGRIYAFGRDGDARAMQRSSDDAISGADRPKSHGALQELLQATGIRAGYCVVVGAKDIAGILDCARASELRFIVIEPDAAAADALRAALRAAQVSADRVAVLRADPLDVELPAYFASLIAVLDLADQDPSKLAARFYASLRPFGGALCLPTTPPQAKGLSESHAQHFPGSAIKNIGEQTLLVREGPLPGSANWTHEHGNAANTRVSRDTLVKAPLGLLWFGGASNDAILPRHGHGPQPQVVDGRLFIEGVDMLRATDIYTGRVLWEAKLPGIGKLYNNTAHQPGANAVGTNYIATPEGVYVAYERACLRLDPATGEQLAAIQIPAAGDGKQPPIWSYLNVDGDYLIGGSEPLTPGEPARSHSDNDSHSSSMRLTIFNRKTAEVLWTVAAKSGFRHNAICIGGGRLYCIDRLSGAQVERLKRRGEKITTPPRMLALDLKTGAELWATDNDVFGTWLSYSHQRDVLVEAGRKAPDSLRDEPPGMRAYQAQSGQVLWHNAAHVGPAMIHHDTVLMAGKACDLLTGAPRMREHPLTGEPVEWRWSRNYGCNTPMASEHLLTFRSGAAGFLDYCRDGGTGNFGGFRSSCTNNLVVAGGLLNAPDYTRTCTCNYQNQASLALVPMPEAELWTSFGKQDYGGPIRRVGINLGAPGDRRAGDGTLWIEHPSVGGDSPEVDIAVEPSDVHWFRRHSAQVQAKDLAWVAASGGEGLTWLKLTLGGSKLPSRAYSVRLHFMEPAPLAAGDRVFDIHLQGKPVEQGVDIVKETGGPLRAIVKVFTSVECRDALVIELKPSPKAARPPVLCGVEVQAEGW